MIITLWIMIITFHLIIIIRVVLLTTYYYGERTTTIVEMSAPLEANECETLGTPQVIEYGQYQVPL